MSVRADAPSAADVGVVVVNWNSSRDLVECVASLRASFETLSIVVVDNGSTREEVLLLDELPGDVHVVSLKDNRGYGAGVNAGIRVLHGAGITWAWLINPDARPDPESLPVLLGSSHGAVALSPRQYSSASAGTGQTYPSAARTRRGRVTPFVCDGCAEGSHEVDVVTGTGLLIAVEAAVAVGLLDEHFFHYKEEFEFVERLSTVGAVRLVCTASVWHRRGGSLAHESPQASYYRVRNELLYLRKKSPLWFLSPRVARTVVRNIAASLPRHAAKDQGRAVRRGVRDGLRGLGGRRSLT